MPTVSEDDCGGRSCVEYGCVKVLGAWRDSCMFEAAMPGRGLPNAFALRFCAVVCIFGPRVESYTAGTFAKTDEAKRTRPRPPDWSETKYPRGW